MPCFESIAFRIRTVFYCKHVINGRLTPFALLTRPRRAHLPPSRKPPPTAPLPDIPQLNFNSSTRKDSLTLPPPSPTVLGFHSRSGESFAPAMQSGIANLLSPSPNFQNSRHLTVKVPSGRHMADLLSSPILGSFNDIPEDEGNDHAIAN